MENASKALLMAASILIAMLVIGLGTYLFNIFGTFSKNQQEKLYDNAVAQFNTQFTKYETMEEITIHDIITLANYAKDYNLANEITDSDSAYITIFLQGIGNIETKSTIDKNTLIQDAINNKIKYKLIDIQYNEKTGRVNKISFIKKN